MSSAGLGSGIAVKYPVLAGIPPFLNVFPAALPDYSKTRIFPGCQRTPFLPRLPRSLPAVTKSQTSCRQAAARGGGGGGGGGGETGNELEADAASARRSALLETDRVGRGQNKRTSPALHKESPPPGASGARFMAYRKGECAQTTCRALPSLAGQAEMLPPRTQGKGESPRLKEFLQHHLDSQKVSDKVRRSPS